MTNNTKIILVGVVALILGLAIGSSAKNFESDRGYEKRNMDEKRTMNHQMNAMTKSLQGKTGDEFDRAFLVEMVIHHEGAVEMANLVLKNSNRAELKKMAEEIIKAQTSEINTMKSWQSLWFGKIPPPPPSGDGRVACTMEAKMCPDGSAVGRQGPNCEFAKCPGE